MQKTNQELHLNETRMMNCGLEATITAYQNNQNITVRFSDGSIRTKVRYQNYKLGKVAPLVHQRTGKEEAVLTRLGETKLMNCGVVGKIIAYRDSHDIDVEFPNGEVAKQMTYWSFKLGSILPPSHHLN